MSPGTPTPDDRPVASPPAEAQEQPTPAVEAVRELLAAPQPAAQPLRGVVLLFTSLVLFVLYLSDNPLQAVLILLGVLFLHELGHLAGMWAFGYRDVRLLFIPFFGAVITARKEAAPPWQQAIVLLLGPLPGVVAGLALYVAAEPAAGTLLFDLAFVLVLLNAFNLLPLAPLDGGRILEVLLFARLPVLGTLFRIVTVGGLAWLALETGWVVFWVLAALMLLATPIAFMQSRAAEAFRSRHSNLPADPAQLTNEQLGDLLAIIHKLLPAGQPPERYAEWVRMIHGQSIISPASLSQVVAFLALYALGLASVVLFLVLTSPR